jgi:hypothetical protein
MQGNVTTANICSTEAFPHDGRSGFALTLTEEGTFEKKNYLYLITKVTCGVRGSAVAKALCYKLEGRGFEMRCFSQFTYFFLPD